MKAGSTSINDFLVRLGAKSLELLCKRLVRYVGRCSNRVWGEQAFSPKPATLPSLGEASG